MPILHKPNWIRSKWPCNPEITKLKKLLREKGLATVCEEAACPNLGECFACGTATFMIMGDTCTRNCRFCNVKHGKPGALDQNEPQMLAEAATHLKLKYVVITSVTRDDLSDGGASHFAACIHTLRKAAPNVKVEILTPDFRYCMDSALEILSINPPDVFNHNIETVPNLYPKVRPSADYKTSLLLLEKHKKLHPNIPTKSGIMLGLGETKEEVSQVLKDLRKKGVSMLTLGQYLQPTRDHLAVERYITPEEFQNYKALALGLGFTNVSSAPLVRSSYHAENQ
ncbi:MAG: lipoyl synthase [Gammaproteobacteria bacterium]